MESIDKRCSSLVRDSSIGIGLLRYDEEEHQTTNLDQNIHQNIIKFASDLCGWIPHPGKQYRRHRNDVKPVTQSKQQNRVTNNLKMDLEAHTRRLQGQQFKNFARPGPVLEFNFQHYNNPKKYIEQYRRFHTFGGPLEKLSTREPSAFGRHRNIYYANDANNDVGVSPSDKLDDSHILDSVAFHNSIDNIHLSRTASEPHLALIARRAPNAFKEHPTGLTYLHPPRGFTADPSNLPRYSALTETAKLRRRASHSLSHFNGHRQVANGHGRKQKKHPVRSDGSYVYASDIPMLPPQTAPERSSKPLQVHLPNGDTMLLQSSKLYSWEQSSFTNVGNRSIEEKYLRQLVPPSQLPQAPYMPGSLIKQVPPSNFGTSPPGPNQSEATLLSSHEKQFSEESCLTGLCDVAISPDDVIADERFIARRCTPHSSIEMIDTFYDQLLQAARVLKPDSARKLVTPVTETKNRTPSKLRRKDEKPHQPLALRCVDSALVSQLGLRWHKPSSPRVEKISPASPKHPNTKTEKYLEFLRKKYVSKKYEMARAEYKRKKKNSIEVPRISKSASGLKTDQTSCHRIPTEVLQLTPLTSSYLHVGPRCYQIGLKNNIKKDFLAESKYSQKETAYRVPSRQHGSESLASLTTSQKGSPIGQYCDFVSRRPDGQSDRAKTLNREEIYFIRLTDPRNGTIFPEDPIKNNVKDAPTLKMQ